MTVSPGCDWTVSGAPGWIAFPAASSGSGKGTVGYQVQPNGFTDRTATLNIGGVSFTVEEEALIANLNFAGSMPHLAAEGGWNTTFTLINKSSDSIETRPSSVCRRWKRPNAAALTFPQQPTSPSPLLGASGGPGPWRRTPR